METIPVRNDILTSGLVIAPNLFSQLQSKTITATETLIARSIGTQFISAAAAQDVVLPDATTSGMIPGWLMVIKNTGAAALTVKANGGGVLKAITSGVTCYFVLVTNATAAGTWHFHCEGVNPRFATTFVIADFAGPTDDSYTYTVAATTHLMGATPMVQVFDSNGIRVDTGIEVNGSGDVELKVTDSAFYDLSGTLQTDGRFDGRIVLV